MPMANLLIVDDEPAAIQIMRKALAGMGELRFAMGGEEALAMVARDPVDLVLLDARMPGLDGYATCAALHRDYPELPVIFVTADSDFASELRGLAAGARDFISKPINPPVVRARVGVHLQLKAQSDLLRALGQIDGLTGIANRRTLEERLVQEWRRTQRQRQPLSVLMIDIDDFKAYNDRYGHLQGDECLRQVAQVIAAAITRASDLVARYGGEEFVALLPGSALAEATALGEKMRAAVASLAIPHATSRAVPWVSLSIGVASCTPAPHPSPDSTYPMAPVAAGEQTGRQLAQGLLGRADQALYAAKAAGRNRVITAEAGGLD